MTDTPKTEFLFIPVTGSIEITTPAIVVERLGGYEKAKAHLSNVALRHGAAAIQAECNLLSKKDIPVT